MESARLADCKEFRRVTSLDVGGGLVGELSASPSLLLDVFGMPETENADNYKTTREWGIEFASGVRAVIYDCKGDCFHVGGQGGCRRCRKLRRCCVGATFR